MRLKRFLAFNFAHLDTSAEAELCMFISICVKKISIPKSRVSISFQKRLIKLRGCLSYQSKIFLETIKYKRFVTKSLAHYIWFTKQRRLVLFYKINKLL